MDAFSTQNFILDALKRERKRVIAEIDAIIAEVEAGRLPVGGTPSAAPPPELAATPEVSVNATPPRLAADLPSEKGTDDEVRETVEESGMQQENALLARSREAFETRKSIAFDAVRSGGGEVPFSTILDVFEAEGIPKEEKRLVRSALSSLAKDERLYNIKRPNPSDNTWALWNHPNAVVARSANGDGEQPPVPPQYDLNSL